jgi:RNA polymerase sigma-70 factor, ECF subfamily
MKEVERGTIVQPDDMELIKEALTGRSQAFAALVDRYRDPVCGMAFASLGSFDDAQDVAQEVFIYAYLHLRELRERGSFAAWLRQITRSHCCDRLRQRDHRPLSLDQVAEQAGEGSKEPVRRIASSSLGEEQIATRIVVREALGRLSEKTRLTVSLFYLGGYSHAEIARFLEVPLNTVRSRLQHAKRQLREEMLMMVTDVLNEGRPDPQFTRRVVDEAIRRAEEAEKAHALGEALRHYDEALAATEKLEPGEEQQRLKMEISWKKGGASRFSRGMGQAVRLYEQSAEIAAKMGDRRSQAEQLLRVAGHTQEREQAEQCYQQALRICRELGDAGGEGECLFWLGRRSLGAREVTPACSYVKQAMPLLEAAGSRRLAAVCRALLRLVAEVGEAAFPTLLAWNLSCDVLEQAEDTVRFARYSDFRQSAAQNGLPPALAVLRARSLFAHLSPLGRLLDATVPVGGSWSGPSWSYSSQPLQTVVTVRSDSDRVTAPAGTFENCLLIEQVTSESGLPDDAPEANRQINRDSLCGSRSAWYAPGVGIVQLRLRDVSEAEAFLQLKQYSVEEASPAYLPLSIGNHWAYTWRDLPETRAGHESYRISACEGNHWYLESYGYLSIAEE